MRERQGDERQHRERCDEDRRAQARLPRDRARIVGLEILSH
jgi:hypothetical protein